MKALLVVALLAAPSSLAPNSTMSSDAWPPTRFQSDNAAKVLFVAPGLIDELCGKAPPGFQTEACQSGNTIVLPNPCGFDHGDDYARLSCHEIGHLGGWPASHGDAQRRV